MRCCAAGDGPRIAFQLGLNPATVHRVLSRYKLARPAHLDRPTGRPVRRYEHAAPGDLVHVDIKKLGNIPDGGHSIHGKAVGNRNKQRTDTGRRKSGKPVIDYHYLHNAVDDHPRPAYTEILPAETKETATTFWSRAQAFFAHAGITVRTVVTDNGSCHRSHTWRDTLAQEGFVFGPQTIRGTRLLKLVNNMDPKLLHAGDLDHPPAIEYRRARPRSSQIAGVGALVCLFLISRGGREPALLGHAGHGRDFERFAVVVNGYRLRGAAVDPTQCRIPRAVRVVACDDNL